MRRLALALGTFILGSAGVAAAEDLEAIQKRGTLRVLIVLPPPDQPHFWSETPGTPPGFEREMIDAFAAMQKVAVQAVPIKEWKDIVPALLDGKGDMIVGRFTETASRAQRMAFTDSIFPTRHVVVNRRPKPVVSSVEELRKERVGTVRGTSLEEAVLKAGVPPARVEDLTSGTLLAALQNGKVTCIVWGVENAIPAQHADGSLQLGAFVGEPTNLAWAVRKSSPVLLARLNEFIAAFRRAEWSKLVVKYFGPSAPELLRRARAE